ncbi:MAG: FtsX-like permease family protein [Acidobacteria bacterium]|nr:FtsX-like permease family protein [Acidobacteriota bacterium]
MLSAIAKDVRYAARRLAGSPWFALVIAVSLGIGIGLTTSVYSQYQSTIFRPLPDTTNPAELVTRRGPTSFADYEKFRDGSGQFGMLAAYVPAVPFTVQGPNGPERVHGHLVTPNYFDVLGTQAHLGRVLGAADREGAAPAAVMSHRLWESRYGGNPALVGQAIKINGQSVTIAGIGPKDFLGASPMVAAADLWLPTTLPDGFAPELDQNARRNRRVTAFEIIGRLAPGVALKPAEAALDAMVRRIEQEERDPARDRGGRRVTLVPGGRVVPIRDEDLPAMTAFPVTLCVLMLWVTCANVGTLLIARVASRRREFAIRLAVGASRVQIIRQLLLESIMLAAMGGVAGYGFAVWSLSSVDAMKPMMPNYVNLDFRMDWHAFAFTAAVTLFTGLLFGLAPALQASKADVSQALKAGAYSNLKGYRWFSTRNILVLQQVMCSLVLLLMTGFIVLGFSRNSQIEVGYTVDGLYSVSLDPVRDGYTPERARELLEKVRDRILTVPGITAAAISQNPPFQVTGEQATVGMSEDMASAAKSLRRLTSERVGAGYFKTLEVPVIRGRDFEDRDTKPGTLVTVLNATAAKELFPGQDAVGRHLEIDEKPHLVVGVVKDIRGGYIIQTVQVKAYVPLDPSRYAKPSREGVALLVRARPGVDALGEVRRLMAAIDPELSVFNARSMTDYLTQMFYLTKLTLVVYGGIGFFSLILAAVGLAGVTAYAVAQRHKEIGIRMALGARPGDVLKLVLRESVAMVLIGSVGGLALALLLLRAMSAYMELLSEVTKTSTRDPLLMAGAPALLAALTLLACYLPARRATGINPITSLREE